MNSSKVLSIRNTLAILFITTIAITCIIIWCIPFSLGISSSKSLASTYVHEIRTRIFAVMDEKFRDAKQSTFLILKDYNMYKLQSVDAWRDYLLRNIGVFNSSVVSTGFIDRKGVHFILVFEGVSQLSGSYDLLWRELSSRTNGRYLSYRVDENSGENIKMIQNTTVDIRTRDWYKTGMEADPLLGTWGRPYFPITSLHLQTYFVVPIFDISDRVVTQSAASNYTRIGIIKTNLSFNFISNFLHNLTIKASGFVIIIEDNGDMIATSVSELQVFNSTNGARYHFSTIKSKSIDRIGKQLPPRKVVSGELSGDMQIRLRDGEYIVSVSAFTYDNIQWAFYLLVKRNLVYKALFNSIYVSIGSLLVILLISFFIVSLPAMFVSQAILKISRKMERLKNISDNDDQSISSDGNYSMISELSMLQQHFTSMESVILGFLKYVPHDVVKTIITSNDRKLLFQPGVDYRDIAVMFTDIVQFTNISEQLDPKVLVDMMTEYFECVSAVIREHKGTLDKYIGDAVMTLFNCPNDLPDYHYQVCLCALSIIQRTSILNMKFSEQGKPKLETRIGIHSGTCLVGNVGSTIRLSYTALGDIVNACSRIEGVNRLYGTAIMISETVYAVVKDKMKCRLIDRVAVKGKSKMLEIYELVGEVDSPSTFYPDFYPTYEQILKDVYFQQKFERAAIEFKALYDLHPHDKALEVMIQRCHHYTTCIQPLPADWDGSTSLDEK
jgi:adenylate cyclase